LAEKLGILRVMTVEFDEQQTDSSPNQFSDSYDECNKYSGTGGHTQTVD
jgi:hypothetical protein